MQLAFIGGGTMAEALIRGALAKGVVTPQAIAVGEPLEERRAFLAEQYGVTTAATNLGVVKGAGLVVLAVKPQNLTEVLKELRGKLTHDQAILSIIAGASLGTLTQGLQHDAVIRVMPNTPAQVGAGMTVWTTTPQVPESAKELALSVLHTLGEEIYVSEEKYLDMATALSASGPAYVFTFIESLTDAGVYLGMPRDMARTLTLQTVLGSVLLLKETGKHPAELRDMVTSPGGTTAEGLLELEEGGFRASVLNAVIAAYQKSLALGEKA